MNQPSLTRLLAGLKLGGLRYFDSTGSTNDEALAWAMDGAADLSLVIADEQTQGRGRLDRRWFTPRGTALAFSLILRPSAGMRAHLSRTVGLAALAVSDALGQLGPGAQVKWPNDILVNGRKAAGILVETLWSVEQADAIVIGIGVNVLKGAVPQPADILFPATSLEDTLGYPPDRQVLLHDILAGLIQWRPRIESDEFLEVWNQRLAYRGEQVQVQTRIGQHGRPENERITTGKLVGLAPDGSLRLQAKNGKPVTVQFGDVSLRPSA